MSNNPSHGLTRRHWLGLAPATVGAYFLPSLARAQQPARNAAPAQQAIVIFCQGGVSHYESFDPKPDAPSEYRGEFGSIATNLPGIRVTEHLPLLAQRTHRYSLIRSVYHPTPDHNLAIHMTLTGWEMLGASIENKNRNGNPAMGAVVAKFRGDEHPELPSYVCVPHRDQLGHRLHYGSAAYLGSAFDPLDSGMLPTNATDSYAGPASLRPRPGLDADRLRSRLALAESFDRPADPDLVRGDLQEFHRRAYAILARDAAGRAFDLNKEPADVRRRYGEHGMGQQALLARRLAEAGVPFTLVNFSLDQVKGQDWDTHVDNFGLMKNKLLPPFDRAVSTLLDDLAERGLLAKTLVAVISEFGRTPRINRDAGRDHWPNVFSVMLAGGGLKSSVVVGASTRGGDEPRDRPVHLYDVLATIYRQLGVPTDVVFNDQFGRPFPVLASGRPVEELL
jgi:uncharacterized protein (DUF1501 family)